MERWETRAVRDCDDARLVIFGKLHDAELRACNFKGAGAAGVREFAPDGLFVAESPRVIGCALDAGMRPFAVLVDVAAGEARGRAVAGALDALMGRWPETPLFLADTERFCRITGYPRSRGIMVVFARPALRNATELLRSLDGSGRTMQRVCIVENVTNYANMALLFKSAAAFGIDAVLITPSCHDPWYRRAIRASEGAVFEVPWACIGASDAVAHWTQTGISTLHGAGFTVAALALREDALPLDDPRLRTPARLAFVLGTEGEGLDVETIAACDCTVIIPMAHEVDSLNVAAASAVAFWEFGHRAAAGQ